MTAAIYARVSTKAKATCRHCAKQVRVVEDRLIEHQNRDQAQCAGSGEELESKADKGQDTENQLLQLREYCARQGWTVAEEYIDRVSGKTANRDSFKRLFDDASQRKFDLVVVWALDRFTREGVYETFDHVRKLSLYGVQFESYTEAHFRTTGPAGELMLAIAAWIAKQERLRISDRTKAGVERARRQGKHCGRPARVFRRDEALDLHRAGLSLREIGSKLGVSFMTVKRAVTKAS